MAARIGEFEIIDKLGQGTMGVVYKARSEAQNLTVAIKVLSPNVSGDPQFVKRFLREMHGVSTMNHPNVVKALDFGIDMEKDVYFVALEFVEGESLKDLLDRQKSVSAFKALDITKKIADGLQHAHEHRMIHRDIKPENILLGKNGDVKLSDFGLIKSDESTSLTQQGMILGTPYYLSPEQAMGEGKVDIRGDIYSLGATLFHMLTGRPPFLAKAAFELLLAHTQNPFPPLKDFLPQIPEEVQELIDKMSRKDPKERFSTPGEVRQAIEELQNKLGQALYVSASSSPSEEAVASLSLTLSGTMSILKGNTEMVGFSELIQSLYSTGKTGILILSKEEIRGEVHFIKGKITHVLFDHLAGKEAFMAILRQKPEQFRFREEDPSSEVTITGDTMGLLMDGMRILDEESGSEGAEKEPRALSHHHTSMIGKLDQISPIEIMNQIFSQGKSGTLVFSHKTSTGQVYFSKGQIIEAEVEGFEGLDGFFELVFWDQGVFRFRDGEPGVKAKIQYSTLGLLMEGNRILQEHSEEL